jgi:hypothetical protein
MALHRGVLGVAVLTLMLCAPAVSCELDGFEEEADVKSTAGATGLGPKAKVKASSFASKVRTVPSSASPSVMAGLLGFVAEPRAIGQGGRRATRGDGDATPLPQPPCAVFPTTHRTSRRQQPQACAACSAPKIGLGVRTARPTRIPCCLLARQTLRTTNTNAGLHREGTHRGEGHEGRARVPSFCVTRAKWIIRRRVATEGV